MQNNFHQWIIKNYADSYTYKNIPWNYFFRCLLKEIWLSRNSLIFEDQNISNASILNGDTFKVAEFFFFFQTNSLEIHLTILKSSVYWIRADNDYMKLNIDGSAKLIWLVQVESLGTIMIIGLVVMLSLFMQLCFFFPKPNLTLFCCNAIR